MTSRLHTTASALEAHGFSTAQAADAAHAGRIILRYIETYTPRSVARGDSLTLRATGVMEQLVHDERYRMIDPLEAGLDTRAKHERRLAALTADLFLTGVNAVTEEGTLHWLDMVGNRIAPIAFGPERVVLVAGQNKIVRDRAEAEERIRTVAAPLNVARHPGFRTPCARTGVCGDCSSLDRTCNTRMEMLRCFPRGRILVVLIGSDLGL